MDNRAWFDPAHAFDNARIIADIVKGVAGEEPFNAGQLKHVG
jgi:hypothetical protein